MFGLKVLQEDELTLSRNPLHVRHCLICVAYVSCMDVLGRVSSTDTPQLYAALGMPAAGLYVSCHSLPTQPTAPYALTLIPNPPFHSQLRPML